LKIKKSSKKYKNFPDDEPKKIYQIHHLHHFLKGQYIKHEIHHCFLFSEKNMKGKKFRVFHKIQGKNFWHCVAGVSKINKLYDHRNNIYRIGKIKIGNKDFFIIIF
jgi:hypothetical protein